MTTAITRLDEQALAELVRPCGPVASVYFGPPPDPGVDPDIEWRARVHALARKLRGDGADPATVAAIEHAAGRDSLTRAAAGSADLALFAAGGHVLGNYHLPGLITRDDARFAAPAHVVPLLGWLQQRPPYVLVIIDRTGADIQTCAGGVDVPHAFSVTGPDHEIERNAPGGWAQLRYQHRAEDSWRHNAAMVGQVCVHALRRTVARLLVLAGDVRATQLLHDWLPGSVRAQVVIRYLAGGRRPDGSEATRTPRVAEIVRTAAAEQNLALLARFADQRGPGGVALEGDRDTLAALRQDRLHTLLLAPHEIAGRAAWFGPEPVHLLCADQGPCTFWPDIHRGRLTDVAIRAALLTRAHVRLLPRDIPDAPADGIGGLCRTRW